MKRFLTQASKSTDSPSKKLKGSGATAVRQNAPSALLQGTGLRQKAQMGLVEQLAPREWTDIDCKGSKVLYWPRLLSGISKRVLASLLQEVPWEQVGSFIRHCGVATDCGKTKHQDRCY